MSIYSDKLAHVQVVINCLYSVVKMCTYEDMLAHNLGAPYFDDVMSYNLLTTIVKQLKCFTWSFDLLRQEKKDLGRGFDQVEDQRPNLIRLFKNLL